MWSVSENFAKLSVYISDANIECDYNFLFLFFIDIYNCTKCI